MGVNDKLVQLVWVKSTFLFCGNRKTLKPGVAKSEAVKAVGSLVRRKNVKIVVVLRKRAAYILEKYWQ